MAQSGTSRRVAPRFRASVVAAIRDGKILGIRAGRKPHRLIGIWAVVVEGRVFIRSWTLSPDGWYRTFQDDPQGVIEIEGRRIRVRPVRTRSERLKTAVDLAYAAKYDTPGAQQYVRGLRSRRRRDTTTELVPLG